MPLRFFTSFSWRHIITDLDLVTITWLDRLASSRRIIKTLNDALEQGLRVPSDNIRVYLPYTDFDPKVDEGVRLLVGFRQETTGNWIPRATGIVMQVHDAPDPEASMTEITAWDPWRYLDFLPVINTDPTSPGRVFAANITAANLTPASYRVDQVVTTLLTEAEANYNALFIDYGQSGFFTGTIENIPFPANYAGASVSFINGSSIGQSLRDLTNRDPQLCDIIMQPLYDPSNRPGLIVQLNVYALAGTQQNTSVMSWDLLPRTLISIDRLKAGTERANSVQFYAGQGGPPVSLKTDLTSQAKFRTYYKSQFFPGQDGNDAYIEDLATAQLLLRTAGVNTLTLRPTPERADVPFLDYDIGDTIPVYASKNLRQVEASLQRVLQIPVSVDENGLESVESMTVKQVSTLPIFFSATAGGGINQQVAGNLATTLARRPAQTGMGHL